MVVLDAPIKGVKVIDFHLIQDERGHFARTFCATQFATHGLQTAIAQINLSCSFRKGTIRGLHFQVPPAAETKVLRCTHGSIAQVVVDLRPESPTFLQHFSIELSRENHLALYVPERFANGYQALTDDAEASYHVTQFYTPGCERGLRFDDPGLAVHWPIAPTVVSQKDRSWPMLDEERLALLRRELQI